jgi:hypothetical protein
MAKPLRMRCHRSSGSVVRSMVGMAGSSSFTSREGSGSSVGVDGAAATAAAGGAEPVARAGGDVSSADNCSACSAPAEALSRISSGGIRQRSRDIGVARGTIEGAREGGES